MKLTQLLGSSLLSIACAQLSAHAQSHSDNVNLQDVIVIIGHHENNISENGITPESMPDLGPDAASMVARLPGAALIDNGGLSGQVQYRGMFGDRINVRVNGQSFASAGPNLMDPPLHYAPLPLIDRVIVDRGISPVRSGPGLAGGVNAILKTSDFSDKEETQFSYDLNTTLRSADSSYAAGGMVAASTQKLRGHFIASVESGDDLEFPDGTILASSHDRYVYGVGAGLKLGDHEIGLDLRRQETDPTGNPPFPMDIKFLHTDFARLSYGGEFENFTAQAHLSYSDADHLMTNFHLRPAPSDTMRWRQNRATAETVNADLTITFPLLVGDLRVGVDAEKTDKAALISNPNNENFYLSHLPDIQSERFGGFAEWTGNITNHNVELGLRVDDYTKTSGTAFTGPALPMMPNMLAMQFNNADRNWDATTTDLTARIWRAVSDEVTVRTTLARKERAPGYIEVYSWLPLTASGGLADGNIYVGNLDIKPETASIFEVGFDWVNDAFFIRPTAYYRQIDDYIQGTAFDDTIGVIDSTVEMVANMNGDSTPLRWNNVDGEIYGIDMDFGLAFNDTFSIDGVASYVEAKRRDINDNLYRIAPPNLVLGANYKKGNWTSRLETQIAAEQDSISTTNNEEITPGYALLNVSLNWVVNSNVHLSLAVDNILDHTWRDHLSGYNRVSNSDVSTGQRLPGVGRNAVLKLHFKG